jgi:hypothetical protein
MVISGVVLVFFYATCPQQPLSPDEEEYLSLGQSVGQSGRFQLPTGEVATRMPLYPAFIAAISQWQAAEPWENGVLLFQTFVAWCTTLLIGLTAERLADGRAGLVAVVIAAFYAPWRFLQMSFLTETLLIFLLWLAIFVYISAGRGGGSRLRQAAALLGVSTAVGLATMTRANGLLFIIPFAADAALRGGTIARRLGRVGLVLLPCVLCVLFWGMRNQRELGRFVLSTSGGLNFYLGHNPEYAEKAGLARVDYQAFQRLRTEQGMGEYEADQHLWGLGFADLRANPGRTAVDSLVKILVWLRTTVALSAPSLLLLATGVVVGCGRRANRDGVLSGRRRLACLAAGAVFWPCLVCWAAVLWETSRPWTSPLEVVPIGLIALAFLRCRPQARGLFAGLFVSQLLVAVAFIPIERIRWTVDGILIVAIAVGVSSTCEWLRAGRDEARAAPERFRPVPAGRKMG